MSKTTDYHIEKKYWMIGEVCQEIGVEASCLRYWEREFKLDIPKKHRYGFSRAFTKENIEKLKEIKRLLKEERFTIEGARKKLCR